MQYLGLQNDCAGLLEAQVARTLQGNEKTMAAIPIGQVVLHTRKLAAVVFATNPDMAPHAFCAVWKWANVTTNMARNGSTCSFHLHLVQPTAPSLVGSTLNLNLLHRHSALLQVQAISLAGIAATCPTIRPVASSV